MNPPRWPRRFLGLVVALPLLAGCSPSARKAESAHAGLNAIKPTDDLATKMARFAEQAAIDAQNTYRTPLDYSPDSIPTVENILDRLARSPGFAKFTDKDIRAEALIFGAYIGEVIRRQQGGHWAEDHPRAGAGSYPLYWGTGSNSSFPYVWCYKRLTLGAEENILHKYQYFVTKQLDPGVAYEVTKEPLRK